MLPNPHRYRWGAGGTGRPGCGARGRRQGQAAVPVGGGGAWPGNTQTPPTDWRPPRGLRGLAGLRADAPSEARGADGERAGRPRGGRRSVGATSSNSRRGESSSAQQAPLVWRVPEGPEGLAAVPVGGGGAWPGFEATRRAKLAARTARGRAAAHGHNQQPGPNRPRGARNTGGATSNMTPPRMRKPRPADAGRDFRYPVGYEV